jgi:hypothetical protein
MPGHPRPSQAPQVRSPNCRALANPSGGQGGDRVMFDIEIFVEKEMYKRVQPVLWTLQYNSSKTCSMIYDDI